MEPGALIWVTQTSYKNKTAEVFLNQESAKELAKKYKELIRKQLEIPVDDKREYWICNTGPREITWSIGSSCWVRIAGVVIQK